MTDAARILYFERRSGARRDEFEGVGADVHVAEGLLNFRHMAAHALVSRTAGRVMGVRLNSRRARTIGRTRTVALQAQHAGRLQQVGVVLGSMDIVAAKAA